MGTLFIEEFERIVLDPVTGEPMPMFGDFRTAQSVTFAGTSVQSAELQPTTRFVTLTSDADCRFAVGTDVDATTSARFLPATQTRFLRATGGDRVAVIEKV